MKSWYIAVCEEHGEAIDIFVSNPSCTAAYLSQYDAQIQEWLERHYGCILKLLGNDLQRDELYAAGWISIDGPNGLRMMMK